MLAREETQLYSVSQGLSPSPQSRRESWVSIVSVRKNSKVLQNDLLLHEAVIKNEVETVKKILKEPVDVNSRNNYGRAPIHWASSRGSTEIMEMLIGAKCDIEAQDRYGMRPILMAAWHGNKEATMLLVNAGASVTAVNKKQYTLLICAAKNNRVDVIDFLESALEEMKVDEVDVENQTALHHAAAGGHAATAKKLVGMGARIDCADKENRTPLHLAAEMGHADVVEFLLQKDAAVNARDEHGNYPLHLSVENKHTKTTQILLDHGSPPDEPNDNGLTALHLASSLGCRGIIDSLLQHGSDINTQTKTGNAPLHFACRRNDPDIVELLISKGADVNKLNFRLESPIHIAAERGFGDICQILLAAGANVQQKAQGGKTPLYVAARGSFTAIVDMIIKTTRVGYSSEDDSKPEFKGKVFKKVGKNRRRHNSEKPAEFAVGQSEKLRSLFYKIAYKHLEEGEWKRLAVHWAFTQEQIKAIEHQYTGNSSYKEHGYRMLLIWEHGLEPETNPLKELYETLVAVGNKKAAGPPRIYEESMKREDTVGAKESTTEGICHHFLENLMQTALKMSKQNARIFDRPGNKTTIEASEQRCANAKESTGSSLQNKPY